MSAQCSGNTEIFFSIFILLSQWSRRNDRISWIKWLSTFPFICRYMFKVRYENTVLPYLSLRAIAIHKEMSHLTCSADQITGFCLKCNTKLKLVNVLNVAQNVFRVSNNDTTMKLIEVVDVPLLLVSNRFSATFSTSFQQFHF